MKKNLALRIASGLMLSCLLTSCVISGTFAKYVSTGSATDTARVAKWGVTVTVTGDKDMFETEYATTTADTGITNSVVATTKVIAPGTSGTLATYSISGDPEVAVNVTKAATLSLTGDWVIDHDNNVDTDEVFYCPIVITIANGDAADTVISGLNYTSATEFSAAVDTALDSNNNIATDGNIADSNNITWSWAISGATGTLNQTEVADTALGNAANVADIGISFSLSVSVTQID